MVGKLSDVMTGEPSRNRSATGTKTIARPHSYADTSEPIANTEKNVSGWKPKSKRNGIDSRDVPLNNLKTNNYSRRWTDCDRLEPQIIRPVLHRRNIVDGDYRRSVFLAEVTVTHEDPLSAARGILFGLELSIGMWLMVAVCWWVVR